jgi:hypothetical protein
MPVVLSHPIKTRSDRDALYSGEVDHNGRPAGYGERVLTSKDEFVGQIDTGVFADGELQGVGKLVTSTGHQLTGEFIRGVLHGVGLWEYPNGCYYVGQLKNGKRHGLGTYMWADGDVIIGWWADDNLHGSGLYVLADGTKQSVKYEYGNVLSQTLGSIDEHSVIETNAFRSQSCGATRERIKWSVLLLLLSSSSSSSLLVLLVLLLLLLLLLLWLLLLFLLLLFLLLLLLLLLDLPSRVHCRTFL